LLSYAPLCLLLAGIALGQANSSSSAAKPVLTPRPAGPTGTAASVSPDTPVLTIQGLCEKPAGSSATPADCQTVITRAEFEKVADAVQPNMPQASKKQFGTNYVMALVLAEKAHELGLDHGPQFDESMKLARLQNLARLAAARIQKDAAQVPQSDIEDYYRAHEGDYKTVSFDRLYVPKQKQVEAAAQKPNDPDAQKKREESEAQMKEEADKLRARAAAGEDFAKLQQEAYDLANYKLKAPNPRVDNARKTSIPATDVGIFDLKKGEVSQVFSDPTGFLIYKIDDIQQLPVTSVHDEIARTIQGERTKNAFDSLSKSTKTTFDESYFATPPPPSLRSPNELPVIKNSEPGNK